MLLSCSDELPLYVAAFDRHVNHGTRLRLIEVLMLYMGGVSVRLWMWCDGVEDGWLLGIMGRCSPPLIRLCNKVHPALPFERSANNATR